MANKNFGVKQINIIGGSGTPTISSPNILNLNAVTVAISTNVSIGGSVVSNVIIGNGYSVGIGTTNPTSALTVQGDVSVSGVSTFTGDGSNVYQYFNSTNAYLDFNSTFNVTKSGVTYISVSGNTASLSENTTLNAAYWRIRTLSTGAEINGLTKLSSSTFGQDNNGVRILTNSTDQADIYHTSAGILNFDNYRTTGGSIAFRVNANGVGSVTEQARITSTGVGIETTNPAYKLDVNGSARVGVDTSAGLILTSPNGTKYQLFVENDGTLKTVAV